MIKSLLILTGLFIGMSLVGQDCTMFFPNEEGTVMEITNYDKKDKVTGSSVQKIVEKSEDDGGLTITVENETYDKKGELVMDGEFVVSCKDGKFYMDMRNFLDEQQLAAYENMEVEVDATDMEFPSNLKAGDKLPDASITVSISSSGAAIMRMTVWITNRVVEANENITTPAGSFDCLKMSYDIETKMVVKVQAKAVQWIAEDVGMVKSESFNKNGKLQGYALLTRLD